MIRAALAALAALFIAVGAVSAADTLGGTLSAGGHKAHVRSTSTITVLVTMTGSDVTVLPSRFTLEPGQSRDVELTGPAQGTLSALLTPAKLAGDSGAAQLIVHLTPATPPADPPWAVLVIALAAVALVTARRFRPWELRVARRASL